MKDGSDTGLLPSLPSKVFVDTQLAFSNFDGSCKGTFELGMLDFVYGEIIRTVKFGGGKDRSSRKDTFSNSPKQGRPWTASVDEASRAFRGPEGILKVFYCLRM